MVRSNTPTTMSETSSQPAPSTTPDESSANSAISPSAIPPSPPETSQQATLPSPMYRRQTPEEVLAIAEELLQMSGEPDGITLSRLPKFIGKYEEKHNTQLLSPDNLLQVQQYCDENPAVSMSPMDIRGLLAAIAAADDAPDDRPEEEIVDDEVETEMVVTPAASNHSRRVSDRIKSPSDSSDTSDEEVQQSSLETRSRKTSASQGLRSFPSASFAVTGAQSASIPARIKRHSSSDLDSPLAVRSRSQPSYGPVSGFAKPHPHAHLRRTSRDVSGHSFDDAVSEAAPTARNGRTISSSSFASTGGRSDSSAGAIDDTSFHEGLKSPPNELVLDESFLGEDQQEEPMTLDARFGSNLNGLMPEAERLARTASFSTLRSREDNIAALEKEKAELSRKLKEGTLMLQRAQAQHDETSEDLNARLDEATAYVSILKRSEADLKNKNKADAENIARLENEVQSLTQRNESLQKAHAEAIAKQQGYINELAAASREVQEKIAELKMVRQQNQEAEDRVMALESSSDAYRSQIEILTFEKEAARGAQEALEGTRQALMDMTGKYERLRGQQPVQSPTAHPFDGHVGPGGSAGPTTMSRNLGAEIHRQLEDQEEQVVEVTTRTIYPSRRSRMPLGVSGTSTPIEYTDAATDPEPQQYVDAGTATEPQPQVDAGTQVDVAPRPAQSDAGTNTENPAYVQTGTNPDPQVAVPQSPSPPAYTPSEQHQPSPREVLEHAHPEVTRWSPVIQGHEAYSVLVEDIGRRCVMYEEELEKQTAVPEKRGFVPPFKLNRKRSQSVPGTQNEGAAGVDWRYGWHAAFSCAFFAVGVMVGGMWLSGGPSQREIDMWTKANTIAFAAGGYGEGFIPRAMMRNVHHARGLIVPS